MDPAPFCFYGVPGMGFPAVLASGVSANIGDRIAEVRKNKHCYRSYGLAYACSVGKKTDCAVVA